MRFRRDRVVGSGRSGRPGPARRVGARGGGHDDPTERLRLVLASQSSSELIESLADPSLEVARAAVGRLVEIEGPRAAPALRNRLLESDLSLVADIARALRAIGERSAVDIAIVGLTGEAYRRRLAAARALGALGERRATDALRGALRDPVAGVRSAALASLGELGPALDCANDCARLLSDSSPHVRITAVSAVARTATRPGALLAPAAADEDRLVRLAVARHVATLPAHAASALLADPDLRVREAAALSAGVGQREELAVLLAHDPSSDVRRAAAQTLGDLGGDEGIADVLVDGVEDPDAIVRAAVLRALDRLLTHDGAAQRLSDELVSGRPARRRAAVYALSHLGGHPAEADVWRLADDPDPDVRLALLHAARSLLADPEQLVRHLAADGDAVVRDSAENWLLRETSGGS